MRIHREIQRRGQARSSHQGENLVNDARNVCRSEEATRFQHQCEQAAWLGRRAPCVWREGGRAIALARALSRSLEIPGKRGETVVVGAIAFASWENHAAVGRRMGWRASGLFDR
jgi:hypothetical protein